jgi:hypothetical protein
MTKVVLVSNGDEKELDDYETLSSVEVRGATGVSRYTLDARQDAVIKIVVNGNVVTHDKDEKKNTSPDPADHPVPQVQTGDAGNSDKMTDVFGNPVYPDQEQVDKGEEVKLPSPVPAEQTSVPQEVVEADKANKSTAATGDPKSTPKKVAERAPDEVAKGSK